MTNKTNVAEAPRQIHSLQPAEEQIETLRKELEELQDMVKSVVEMVDSFHANALDANFIRCDVVEGALQMISGRLRMALNDY